MGSLLSPGQGPWRGASESGSVPGWFPIGGGCRLIAHLFTSLAPGYELFTSHSAEEMALVHSCVQSRPPQEDFGSPLEFDRRSRTGPCRAGGARASGVGASDRAEAGGCGAADRPAGVRSGGPRSRSPRLEVVAVPQPGRAQRPASGQHAAAADRSGREHAGRELHHPRLHHHDLERDPRRTQGAVDRGPEGVRPQRRTADHRERRRQRGRGEGVPARVGPVRRGVAGSVPGGGLQEGREGRSAADVRVGADGDRRGGHRGRSVAGVPAGVRVDPAGAAGGTRPGGDGRFGTAGPLYRAGREGAGMVRAVAEEGASNPDRSRMGGRDAAVAVSAAGVVRADDRGGACGERDRDVRDRGGGRGIADARGARWEPGADLDDQREGPRRSR